MNFCQTTLPNGIRVITDRVDTVETVTLGVWVNVGSRNEEEKVSGISHFLEHMAFKGTARRTALDIAVEIENVGGQLNAYTSNISPAHPIVLLLKPSSLSQRLKLLPISTHGNPLMIPNKRILNILLSK